HRSQAQGTGPRGMVVAPLGRDPAEGGARHRRSRGGASPSPDPGDGARDAPAGRPLPPRPRQALPAYGQARAGAGAPHHGDDDVSRDGYALLAGSGGGAGAVTEVLRHPAALPFLPARFIYWYRPGLID